MTITVNLTTEVAERLRRQAQAQGSDLPGLVRHLAEREALAEAQSEAQSEARPESEARSENDAAPASARIPGLHAGQYVVADDFDAPLPDSFWLGDEGRAAGGQAP